MLATWAAILNTGHILYVFVFYWVLLSFSPCFQIQLYGSMCEHGRVCVSRRLTSGPQGVSRRRRKASLTTPPSSCHYQSPHAPDWSLRRPHTSLSIFFLTFSLNNSFSLRQSLGFWASHFIIQYRSTLPAESHVAQGTLSKTPSPSCRYSKKAFCYSDVFSYCYVELIKGFISATALLVLKFTAQGLRFFLFYN